MAESLLEVLDNHTEGNTIKNVPVSVISTNERDLATNGMIRKLKRETLHYLQEAEMYSELISKYGLTQEELATKINKNQSTISNKLRLLRLSPIIKKLLCDNCLTERHARALLKIKDSQFQLKVIKYICKKRLNVRMTEEIVDRVMQRYFEPSHVKVADNSLRYNNDSLETLVNSIKHALTIIKKSGGKAKAAKIDKGRYLEFIIRVQK